MEKGVASTIKSGVPAEKLILGVPFYTRIWKIEEKPGGEKVTSAAAPSMEGAENAVRDNGGAFEWDEGSGQYYGEYIKDGVLYKVWLEDENSMDLRMKIGATWIWKAKKGRFQIFLAM